MISKKNGEKVFDFQKSRKKLQVYESTKKT